MKVAVINNLLFMVWEDCFIMFPRQFAKAAANATSKFTINNVVFAMNYILVPTKITSPICGEVSINLFPMCSRWKETGVRMIKTLSCVKWSNCPEEESIWKSI